MNTRRHQPLTDSLLMRGHIEYILRDARNGRIVRKGKGHNVVTFMGRGWALAQINSVSSVAAPIMLSLAVGTSTAATATSQTNLGSYVTIRNAGTEGFTSSTSAAPTYTMAVSWASNESLGSIGEFALYNRTATNAASAIMFNRVTTATQINFQSTNTLAVTITITN
mgnify:FL=1